MKIRQQKSIRARCTMNSSDVAIEDRTPFTVLLASRVSLGFRAMINLACGSTDFAVLLLEPSPPPALLPQLGYDFCSG